MSLCDMQAMYADVVRVADMLDFIRTLPHAAECELLQAAIAILGVGIFDGAKLFLWLNNQN